MSLPVAAGAAADEKELVGEVRNITLNGQQYVYNTITWYYVNNKYIDFNSNGIPMATLKTSIPGGDVNLLPIRGVAEALGAQIYSQGDDIYRIVLAGKYCCDVKAWDNRIDVRKPNGNTTTYVTTLTASCPVVEYEDTIYIPFRDIVRALFVPDGTMEDTDKYIKVTEIVPESGFYRIYVSTVGKFDIVHKEKITHNITFVLPNGQKKEIAVYKGYMDDNFKKFLYRTYVSTENVNENFKNYADYCSYQLALNPNAGFRKFSTIDNIKVENISIIAPNSRISNGKLK